MMAFFKRLYVYQSYYDMKVLYAQQHDYYSSFDNYYQSKDGKYYSMVYSTNRSDRGKYLLIPINMFLQDEGAKC